MLAFHEICKTSRTNEEYSRSSLSSLGMRIGGNYDCFSKDGLKSTLARKWVRIFTSRQIGLVSVQSLITIRSDTSNAQNVVTGAGRSGVRVP